MENGDVLIAVVDDDPGVCRSVARALEGRGYRVQTYTTAQQYIASRHAINPACVVADLRMPGMGGLDLHRVAHEQGADVPMVFMTAVDDVPTVVEAMKTGAVDLLSKPFSAQALFDAVNGALERARESEGEQRDLEKLWRSVEHLTPREAEITVLVASGLLNKQVAALSGITEKTVKVHRARAMRKLGVGSLADMVRVVDHVLAERDRPSLSLNGGDVPRPPAVDVMVRALARAREQSATKAQ